MTDNLKVCYLCGSDVDVDLHHCIHGKEWRKLSTQYHLIVGLCYSCHRGPCGVHNKQNGQAKDLKLKHDAQVAWESRRMRKKGEPAEAVREEWLSIFKEDYIGKYNDLEEHYETVHNSNV